MAALLDAALGYAERGWPVFPCSPRDKRPLVAADRDENDKPIKGTGGCKKASTDPDQLRAWWGKWPNAMIGVAMGGNGLFVLDFDPRTDDATGEEWTLDSLKGDLEEQVGAPLPVSLAVRTPSGGVHVYLNQPAGDPIRNRGNLPRHVDVRGEGGYVIVPPSVMDDGRRYRWLRDDAEAAIVDAPAELVAILQPRKAAKRGQPELRVAGGTDGLDRYAQTALAELTIQPEQLDRNPFLINVLNGTLELFHEPDAPEVFDDLDKQLAGFSARMTSGVLQRALKRGAAPIVDRAKQMVPVDTGRLQKAITTGKRSTVAASGRIADGEATLFIGVAGFPATYADDVEFGQLDHQAQPFMRPAFVEKVDEAVAIVKTELAAEIVKTRARADRRAAKEQGADA